MLAKIAFLVKLLGMRGSEPQEKGWLERVKRNLFPLSENQQDIHAALKEWAYFGDMNDLGEPLDDCELCDHPDIRYQFEIVNRINSNILLIGSECITRFGGIGVVDTDGSVLEGDDAQRKVRSDKRKLIVDAQTKGVLNALIELKSKDADFEIQSFIEYYQENGAFTPNQLFTLLWRLEKAGISFKRNHLKMKMRRDREKEQIIFMANNERWRLQKLLPCLSHSQKEFLKREGLLD